MGWTPYPTALNGYAPGGQVQGAPLPYTAQQLNSPSLPSSIRDTMQAAQTAQAAATSTAPYTSGLATGLKALSGYVGGQLQGQADQTAASYQGGQPDQPSPSLLAKILRGGASSDPSADDGSGSSMPAATGWGAVGQGVGQAAQSLGRKSDRRLKSEVTRIGTLACGLPVYAYRLEGSPLFEVGVMADEVARVRPDATWFDPDDGFARVAYERLI